MSYYCEKCGKLVSDEDYFGSGRFCSRACANSGKGLSKEQNLKRITSLKVYQENKHKNGEYKEKYLLTPKYCIDCNSPLSYERKHLKYCESCSKLRKHARNVKAGLSSASSRAISKRSKNEIYFCELCEKYFNNVKHNVPMFNGWDADVIIEDIKYAVLWNGKWHYEQIMEGTSLKQIQNRDKIKISEIEFAGYTPYIIKDLGKYNKEFVEEQFNLFIKNTASGRSVSD